MDNQRLTSDVHMQSVLNSDLNGQLRLEQAKLQTLLELTETQKHSMEEVRSRLDTTNETMWSQQFKVHMLEVRNRCLEIENSGQHYTLKALKEQHNATLQQLVAESTEMETRAQLTWKNDPSLATVAQIAFDSEEATPEIKSIILLLSKLVQQFALWLTDGHPSWQEIHQERMVCFNELMYHLAKLPERFREYLKPAFMAYVEKVYDQIWHMVPDEYVEALPERTQVFYPILLEDQKNA
ncbi:hypothetical protein AGDE_16761 [Angomonas deanei]|uniref:Uncharacterized protein n=1 Tax=Angomonas deanei TaxID=59799 RepID=A0A7G2CU17_9TRYP|nr:hypothetical protein AGDE_16761 [Angomonas deanei]CAD2222561.1 hypothetical protein, conserved [Angomonas deanei]|eukprot:EPY16259.1 hypothetical protein AGDE_16761 [Angomonas deanei]